MSAEEASERRVGPWDWAHMPREMQHGERPRDKAPARRRDAFQEARGSLGNRGQERKRSAGGIESLGTLSWGRGLVLAVAVLSACGVRSTVGNPLRNDAGFRTPDPGVSAGLRPGFVEHASTRSPPGRGSGAGPRVHACTAGLWRVLHLRGDNPGAGRAAAFGAGGTGGAQGSNGEAQSETGGAALRLQLKGGGSRNKWKRKQNRNKPQVRGAPAYRSSVATRRFQAAQRVHIA